MREGASLGCAAVGHEGWILHLLQEAHRVPATSIQPHSPRRRPEWLATGMCFALSGATSDYPRVCTECSGQRKASELNAESCHWREKEDAGDEPVLWGTVRAASSWSVRSISAVPMLLGSPIPHTIKCAPLFLEIPFIL